jgi:HEAT repeat protein
MHKLHTALALAFSFVAASPALHASPVSAPMLIFVAPDDSTYSAGTRAMNERRWPDAVREFDKVISDKNNKKVDAAIYWKAYSLAHMSRQTEASAACDQLHAQFPSSTWNNDCRSLTIDQHILVKNGPMDHVLVKTPNAPGSDDDLKLLALNSLANQDPARAMPILREMLTGNHSDELKKHAIFVLTQSNSPEAASILRDAVAGKMGVELQRQTIPLMGVFHGKRDNDTLVDVYKNTQDQQVKRAVISALFISQDAPHMVDLARNEKDLHLKRSIVSQLALMNDKVATDYMLELLK